MDLDNAHSIDEEVPESTAKDLVMRPQTALDGQAAARDKHTHKIFLIDRSASMRDEVTAQSRLGLLVWPADVFDWARKRITNAMIRQAAEQSEFLDDVDEYSSGDALGELHKIAHDKEAEDERWAELSSADDDKIRAAVLRYALTVPLKEHKQFTVPKYELVRAVVARYIRDRVHKYPDAKFYGIMFDSTVHRIEKEEKLEGRFVKRPPTAEEIITAVYENDFYGGGTNITAGLRAAVALCKRSPSPVKLHHIIMVTDGLDYRAIECVQFVEKMQELGICLDVVHITSYPDTVVGNVLKEVCTQTGGEYQAADDVEAFQTKMLNAAGRLLLTAGGGK